MMRKSTLVLLIFIAGIIPFFIFRDRRCSLIRYSAKEITEEEPAGNIDIKNCTQNLLKYLKIRKDNLALKEAGKILSIEPDNTCALWAKAEVLRRTYKFKESEEQLNQILSKYPEHPPSLISLSYIKYHNNDFKEALEILQRLVNQPGLDRENLALSYMLIGSINAQRASQGGFLCKIAYGMRIRGFFEKAKTMAPDLVEVHLGLGTFYLLAPGIGGGSLNKAIEELEYALQLTPDFATVNARLAQAYKEKGDLEKYNFYLQRAKELDPENEVLYEELRD